MHSLDFHKVLILSTVIVCTFFTQEHSRASEPSQKQLSAGSETIWNVLPKDERNPRLLRNMLLRAVGEQYEQRRRELAESLKSPEKLLAYRDKKRSAYLKLLGPLPERTPLRSRVTGRIECRGYTDTSTRL